MNRNRKKLTVSRKKAKILTVNRKSHYPIETLIFASFRPNKKKQLKENKNKIANCGRKTMHCEMFLATTTTSREKSSSQQSRYRQDGATVRQTLERASTPLLVTILTAARNLKLFETNKIPSFQFRLFCRSIDHSPPLWVKTRLYRLVFCGRRFL